MKDWLERVGIHMAFVLCMFGIGFMFVFTMYGIFSLVKMLLNYH